MRSSLRLLMFVGLLAAVAAAAGPDSSAPLPAQPKEDPLHANRRLLEKWKADPQRNARLQRDLEAFWALPQERRELLRQFDRDLHHEDSATQQRLWGVLERYHAWLERLPPEQRARVQNARDKRERLAIIKEIVDDEWVKQQPLPVQNEMNALTGEKKSAEIARLREEQRQRRRDAVQRIPGDRPPRKDKMPTRLADFPEEVRTYLNDSLWPLLSEAERFALREAERRPWPASARKLMQLAEKHPIPLPGPIGPVRIGDLPPQVQEQLKRRLRAPQLERVEGRWPEFGETLLGFQLGNRPNVLPDRVMPKSAADLPEELKRFVARMEKESLTPEEVQQLKKAEGNWPAYPRAVLALAQKKKLTVPGMTLPPIPDLWDRAQSALPEVPAHRLFHFIMNELTGDERKRMADSPDDPTGREWVKKEFFRRYPKELKRLQQLDVRPPRPGGPRSRND